MFKKLLKVFKLSFGLLLIAGCATQSADFVIKNKVLSPLSDDEVKECQYSAPWDKAVFGGFFETKKEVGDVGEIKGAIVPHHLTAGYMPATLFDYLKNQSPSTIVIIGPNHFSRGYSNIITSDLDWKTPFGQVTVNHNTIRGISAPSADRRVQKLVVVDESVVKEEHSIYSLVAFISKSLPDAKIIPLILKNNIKTNEMDELIAMLEQELPKDAVIVSSIDFSHYQTAPVSAFHDELSKTVIKNFDFARLDKLEIDSTPSLYVLLKLMEKFGAQKPVYEMYDNPGQTSHYSVWFGEGEKQENKVASLLFFGDMMLDRNVAVRIKEHGADWLFSALAGEENRFFQGVDDIHVNLEGTFMDKCPSRGSMSFCFDAKLIPTLKKCNFSIFNLANNHVLNMSNKGFDETRDKLSESNLGFYGDPYGAGIFTREISGIKIAFLNFNNIGNKVNEEGIRLTIQAAKTESDFVIVSPHWGEEYQYLKSNKHQQDLAHKMIDAGADAIIGHHSHVAQEMEVYKNKPIFYSLGNFIFDQYFSPETQMGLAVGLVLSESGEKSIYVFPLQSVQSQVKLMSGEPLNVFFGQFIAKSRLDNREFDDFNIKL